MSLSGFIGEKTYLVPLSENLTGILSRFGAVKKIIDLFIQGDSPIGLNPCEIENFQIQPIQKFFGEF